MPHINEHGFFLPVTIGEPRKLELLAFWMPFRRATQ